MKIINLNTGEGYKSVTFPDGQPHITIEDMGDEYLVKVICSITSSKKLIELYLVAEVLNRRGFNWELHIPYLMGARYDRVMEDDKGDLLENDSFDLRAISRLINSMGADEVYLFDPHSEVATALICGVKVTNNKSLVVEYDKEDSILIIPDAGAAKKAGKYLFWNDNITDVVHCIKHRDPETGKLELKVLEAEKTEGRNCVIIDDICDGGRTFNMIADQLKNTKSLTLIVTHGIFSAGFGDLGKRFNQIIVSDSYQSCYEEGIGLVKLINYGSIS